jgi:predicted transposase/invertase (TIGR01784 family)
MPIGIRPTNDFAFKKTFGTPSNKISLISLLNSILDLPTPIEDVTIENPYNIQDFQDDKLSILDIKAVDAHGAIYDIEMQLTIFEGLIKRLVFYGCEIYAGQLKHGEDYSQLHPAYSICLVNGQLWQDSEKVHNAFRLSDKESGRTLSGTLEIHTLEFGVYNLQEADLVTASTLECWLFWFLHAHEYEADTLMKLFPQAAIQRATQSLYQIAQLTEDKVMYDAREKAIRDQQWAINASFREGEAKGQAKGEIKGEMKLIRTLQELLGIHPTNEDELRTMEIDSLQKLAADLQNRLRGRASSE